MHRLSMVDFDEELEEYIGAPPVQSATPSSDIASYDSDSEGSPPCIQGLHVNQDPEEIISLWPQRALPNSRIVENKERSKFFIREWNNTGTKSSSRQTNPSSYSAAPLLPTNMFGRTVSQILKNPQGSSPPSPPLSLSSSDKLKPPPVIGGSHSRYQVSQCRLSDRGVDEVSCRFDQRLHLTNFSANTSRIQTEGARPQPLEKTTTAHNPPTPSDIHMDSIENNVTISLAPASTSPDVSSHPVERSPIPGNNTPLSPVLIAPQFSAVPIVDGAGIFTPHQKEGYNESLESRSTPKPRNEVTHRKNSKPDEGKPSSARSLKNSAKGKTPAFPCPAPSCKLSFPQATDAIRHFKRAPIHRRAGDNDKGTSVPMSKLAPLMRNPNDLDAAQLGTTNTLRIEASLQRNNSPDNDKPPERSRKKGSGKAKPFPCPVSWCKLSFTRANDVQRHVNNAAIHKQPGNKDAASTRCGKCGEELSRLDARKRHELKGSCGKRRIVRKPPGPHPTAPAF